MHWRIKGLTQKVLGHLPGGEAVHLRLQRRFGGLQDFPGELATKIEDWRIMVGHLRNADVVIADTRFFEIGTGWYPIFPLALFLAGARRIVTYDLTRHLSMDLTRAAVVELDKFLPVIAEASGADATHVKQRHHQLTLALANGATVDAATEGAIQYAAPADATRTDLADGAIDVVFSNSVLEHVPQAAISAMYRESLRILGSGGLMFHSVNCGDHYAYVDRTIHQLNYLRYSDRAWKFWNNSFLYQNRMRAHEFVDAAAAHGFQIELDTATARPQRLAQLAEMTVHPQFAHVAAEKLCITSVDFIARRPLTAPLI